MKAAMIAMVACVRASAIASAEPRPTGTVAAGPLLYAFSEYWDLAGAVGVSRHVAIDLTMLDGYLHVGYAF
jgi:hypothetical protein